MKRKPNDGAPVRAFAYLRVSDPRQAEERHVSLPVQLGKINEYCKVKRYVLTETFKDEISGRKDSRADYQRMVARVRAGEADVVVVQFLDRFGRNPKEILRRIWELQDVDVRVECVDENIEEELILLIRAGIAGKESEKIGARVRPALQHRFAQGRWVASVPMGYRVGPAGSLVIEPTEAAKVREIFRLYTEERLGFSGVAARLNQTGVKARRGGAFWPVTVGTILRDVAYRGVQEWSGQRRGNAHEAIIDEATWAAAQEQLHRRHTFASRRDGKESHYLAGLVRCTCGQTMYVHSQIRRPPTKAAWVQRDFRCSRRNLLGLCRVSQVSALVLGGWLDQQLAALDVSAAVLARARALLERNLGSAEGQRERRRKELEAIIKKLTERRRRTYDLFVDTPDADREMYLVRDAEDAAVLAAARTELAQLPTSRSDSGWLDRAIIDIRTLQGHWRHATETERARLLSAIFEAIEIRGSGQYVLIPRPEMAILLESAP